MANCFTESSLRYKVKHSIKSVVGICGIDKRYWSKDLKENNIPINSLKAGEMVMNYLLVKHKGNKYEALKEYKGSIKNLKPVHSVLELEKRLKDKR